MNTDKTIDILNNLVEINNDRIEGYKTASDETKESDLKQLFSQLIQTSQKCKADLIAEIQRLGGKPADGTKVSGKFFRAWMDVKAAITNKDRKKILDSCITGDDVAVDTYNKVLKNKFEDLTPQQEELINTQFGQIKADHTKIKQLQLSAKMHS